MTVENKLEVRELKPGFGAEVLDVDVAKADDETHQHLVEVFHRHGALLLRGQSMNPMDLMRFIRAFGEPEGHVDQSFTVPEFPEIYVLSNREEKGRPIGAHLDGIGWHTDYSFKEKPVMSTMLYALEVPEEGGDTLLADCCAAYDALPEARKSELDPLVLHHSYLHFMETRKYGRKPLTEKIKSENPDVFHPLIRRHPADGRKALWVSTGTVKDVLDMPHDEGMQLIEDLVDYVTQEKFVFRHEWRVGDILTWDNRCTLHSGSLFDDKKYFRHMHRLWVKGDRPY